MSERDWNPIETAPKDGTDIILGAPEQTFNGQPCAPRSTVGHWTSEEECRVDIGDCGGYCHCREYEYVEPSWISWDGGFTAENPPTHWRPLPLPPSPGEVAKCTAVPAPDTMEQAAEAVWETLMDAIAPPDQTP